MRHARQYACRLRASTSVVLLTLSACAYDRPLAQNEATARAATSSPGAATSRPDSAPGVAVDQELRVGPDRIGADSLWHKIEPELRQQSGLLTADGYRAFLDRRAAELITDEISEILLYQRASLRVADPVKDRVESLVDADVRRIISTQHDGIERRYVKHLESRGQTLDEVRSRIRREYVIAAYLEQEVKPRIPQPTRDELWAAYTLIVDSQDRPERRRMSLVDIRVSEHLPRAVTNPTREQFDAARSAARTKGESALEELKNGVDFSEVARKYSDGLHAGDGGAWGWVSRGSVRERFIPAVDALYTLDEGAVTGLIESTDGFMIVRCDEIDRPETPDFQAMQPQLEEQYFRGMYNRHIMEIIGELREQVRLDPQDLERFHRAVIAAAPPQSAMDAPAPQ